MSEKQNTRQSLSGDDDEGLRPRGLIVADDEDIDDDIHVNRMDAARSFLADDEDIDDDIHVDQMEAARSFLWDVDSDDEDDTHVAGGKIPAFNFTATGELHTLGDCDDGDLEEDDPRIHYRAGIGTKGSLIPRKSRATADDDLHFADDSVMRGSDEYGFGSKRRGAIVAAFCKYSLPGLAILFLIIVMTIGTLALTKNNNKGGQGDIEGNTSGDESPDAGDGDGGATSEQGSDGEVMNPGQFNPQLRFDAFSMKLIDSGYVDASELKKSGTPQSYALEWLANEDSSQIEVEDEFMIQRYALVVLFFSSSGAPNPASHQGVPGNVWVNQENWMTGKGYCSWYGVECIGDQGTTVEGNADVFSLNLTSNKLEGFLESDIRALTKLNTLDLSSNRLIDTIPTEVAEMQSLRSISLYDNEFIGTMPGEFGEMENLRELNLGKNKLNGEMPSTLSQLTNLRALSLERNQFHGTIPNLQHLENLELLYLDRNKLQGEIPKTLYGLTNLVELRLGINQLSGTIADQMGNLNKLEILHLTQNQFEGPLPDFFERLTHLVELYLTNNQFTGTLPGTIGKLTSVEYFFLNNNQFSGALHENVGQLVSAKIIYLHQNSFTGSIPDVFENMSNLEILKVHDNTFVGSIPKSLGACATLSQLVFENNGFEGEVPTELGNLQNLERITIENNDFTGTMPTEVCALFESGVLDLLDADCEKEGGIACDCCTTVCVDHRVPFVP